jgi:hypothetical protein
VVLDVAGPVPLAAGSRCAVQPTPRHAARRRVCQRDDDFFANVPNGENQVLWTLLPKSVSLAGGIPYIDHRVDNATGRAIVTRAELYADVFSCTLPTPEYQPNATLDCDWAHSFPLANTSIPPPYAPTGSLRLPAAYGSSSPTPTAFENSLVRWGGASSSAALTAWLSTTPTGAADAANPVDWTLAPSNVSIITQPLFMNGVTAGFYAGRPVPDGVGEVMGGRYHLPLAYTLDEAELNSDTSDFTLGSAAVLTHLLPFQRNKLQPHVISCTCSRWYRRQRKRRTSYRRPLQPQHNSTRLRLLHAASRSHAAADDGHDVHRGLSERLIVQQRVDRQRGAGCLWPMDPSYRSLLGPLSLCRSWIIRATGLWMHSPRETGVGYVHSGSCLCKRPPQCCASAVRPAITSRRSSRTTARC